MSLGEIRNNFQELNSKIHKIMAEDFNIAEITDETSLAEYITNYDYTNEEYVNLLQKNNLSNSLITKKQALELFSISKIADYLELFSISSQLRDLFFDSIEITSTIHITNICSVVPKCKYCGYAAGTSTEGYVKPFRTSDEMIQNSAKAIQSSGLKRVSCSSGHGYDGLEVLRALKNVKKVSNLKVLVNAGADLTENCIIHLKNNNVDTICCNLESINENVFNSVKPGEKLQDRIEVCENILKHEVELSSGLLIGIGESYEDRVNHLNFLKDLNVQEIPIMGFNPYKNTPMEHHPKCSALEQAKTIAITRLMFPNIRITSPTPTIGAELMQYALMAGASNVATVIPDNHPMNIVGVGSPKTGNLNNVCKMIEELGLKPDIICK
ncbi:5,10-methenyltetrahydromethanopterin hydrogenase cofactor biosynthesis protein HmdB [Methanococcus voltae]|uniref:Radical SAM domain protein n=1 Tax=Methanococcus voltae (strain ATCC BAA-1334 / A3) TaxID=456320 RepID=D7DV44_METV3|nr:5,10-methenyltetrahydromethanopterin hydrogenase cofactor biosynthesis protein HmdB [Methanococcus voltae]MCS3900809.1 biotin synthase [Methanococcus voltae]